jgi:hypothetical protein
MSSRHRRHQPLTGGRRLVRTSLVGPDCETADRRSTIRSPAVYPSCTHKAGPDQAIANGSGGPTSGNVASGPSRTARTSLRIRRSAPRPTRAQREGDSGTRTVTSGSSPGAELHPPSARSAATRRANLSRWGPGPGHRRATRAGIDGCREADQPSRAAGQPPRPPRFPQLPSWLFPDLCDVTRLPAVAKLATEGCRPRHREPDDRFRPCTQPNPRRVPSPSTRPTRQGRHAVRLSDLWQGAA